MSDIDLNHRLEMYDTKKPDSLDIANIIETKTNQSCAILALIQNNFTGENETKLTDEIIFNALQSVCLELMDIKSIANHYHDSHKELMTLQANKEASYALNKNEQSDRHKKTTRLEPNG